jgi:hypothetical protein
MLSLELSLGFVDGQVCLVCLQMDNFCLFLCQQTDKPQTSICMMSKRKHINKNCLGICFPFERAAYVYTYTETAAYIDIQYTENRTNRKRQFYLLLQTKNGNGKLPFFWLQTGMENRSLNSFVDQR